jgi:ammonia channel protein AmtB
MLDFFAHLPKEETLIMSSSAQRVSDFAGGIVIHVSWIGVGVSVAGILLAVWLIRRKR